MASHIQTYCNRVIWCRLRAGKQKSPLAFEYGLHRLRQGSFGQFTPAIALPFAAGIAVGT